MGKLSHAIKQLGYRHGELKVVVTGTLTEVSQADAHTKRQALKVEDSNQQSYILLENAPLEASLKTAQPGQLTTLTGWLSVYKNKHYLWLLPKEKKRQKVTALKGHFLAKGNQLIFKNASDEYLVLENALREKLENTKEYAQKKWSVRALPTEYRGKKYLFLKKV